MAAEAHAGSPWQVPLDETCAMTRSAAVGISPTFPTPRQPFLMRAALILMMLRTRGRQVNAKLGGTNCILDGMTTAHPWTGKPFMVCGAGPPAVMEPAWLALRTSDAIDVLLTAPRMRAALLGGGIHGWHW